MLCERCKIREANIQYTEVMNGTKTEHHFCSQCAKELDFGQYSAIFDSEFPLGKLLSGLLGVAGLGNEEEKSVPQIVCPTCRTSYEEFVKNSRFGCPDCYGVFDLLISENIKQLQGSDTHKGKRPGGSAKMSAVPFVTREREPKEAENFPGSELPAADLKEKSVPVEAAPAPQTEEKPQLLSAAQIAEQEMKRLQAQAEELEKQLKAALKVEDYDRAAACRDEIRHLKEQLETLAAAGDASDRSVPDGKAGDEA